MRKCRKMVAAVLIACLLLTLPGVALALSLNPSSLVFTVGDTPQTARKQITATEETIPAASITSYAWTAPSGYAIYTTSDVSDTTTLANSATATSVWIGVAQGTASLTSGNTGNVGVTITYATSSSSATLGPVTAAITVQEAGTGEPNPADPETPNEDLADLASKAANQASATTYEELESLGGIASLAVNPANLSLLNQVEAGYAAKANVTISSPSDTSGAGLNPAVVGTAFNAESGQTVKLDIAPPAEIPALNSSQYNTENMVVVDIDLLIGGAEYLDTLRMPIAITIDKPAGLSDNFAILHYRNGVNSAPTQLPHYDFDGKCTFIVDHFSVFAFVDVIGGNVDDDDDDSPAPIVAVLYDVAKSGDAFAFKTIIANGSGRMAGTVVTVRLNDTYSTTVTIGEDGVGYGTIEAPGYAWKTANISTRPHVPGGASVSTTYEIYSTGKVVRK